MYNLLIFPVIFLCLQSCNHNTRENVSNCPEGCDTVMLYYKSGAVKGILHKYQNHLCDTAKYFFENGQLSEWWIYKDGVKEGSFKTFNKDGKLRSRGLFVKDSCVDGEYWYYKKDGTVYDHGRYLHGVFDSLSPTPPVENGR